MAAPVLKSERVIINAPMSFAGAAQRSFRLRALARNPVVVWVLLTPVAVFLTLVWWVAVALWYVGVIVILAPVTLPYRFLRRGARKRRAEALRHRETLAALERPKG